MAKSWYTIKAAAPGSDTAEVHILEEIGYGGVNAKSFLADFRAITAPKIKLFINSPGGSVFDAVAMFNGMRSSGKNIEVHILGIAASAASYIAMAGDKIIMPANTMMFVHNPINGVYGNADDMREMADILDKIGASLTSAYAKRFTGEAKVLDALLADESYLTAAECLEHGFCDEVTDEIPVAALFDIDQLPENVQALFKAKIVTPVAPATPLADDVAGLAKDAGFDAAMTAVFVTDPSVVSLESAAKVIANARDIKAFAVHAGLPERAEPMIRARKTAAEARTALAAELAERDAALNVDTATPSKTLQGPQSKTAAWGPMSMWAEIKAMKAGSK